jgi:hypothetical protein
VGLFVLTLPSTLALAFPGENPHLSRANPVLPVVMVLAALPARLAIDALGSRLSTRTLRWWLPPVLVGGVVAAYANYQSYFVDYAALHRANTQNQKEVAQVIRGFADLMGSDRNAYLPVWPFWVDYRIVALEMGDFDWRDRGWVPQVDEQSLRALPAGPKLYVLHKDNTRDLATLQRVFPQAIVREHPSGKPGKDFRSVLIPG